jgi:ribose transport system permease protein
MSKKVEMNILVPFLLMLLILIIFTVATGGNMISAFNLKAIIDQSILVIIAGLGTIFVVAQGGADLSVGTTVGITTVVSTAVATAVGNEWIVFPVAVIIALAQGLLNGVLVARLRIPSFMATLAILIGMRGVINFVQTKTDLYYASGVIMSLKHYSVKIPVLIILILAAYYLLEYTKFGQYCRAIGENEMVAVSVGIPVRRIKIYTFMLSSLMAGITGLFTIAKVGAPTRRWAPTWKLTWSWVSFWAVSL